MRRISWLGLMFIGGCTSVGPLFPDRPLTSPPSNQVGASLKEPRNAPAPTKINFPPASPDASARVLLIKDQLVNANLKFGMKPYVLVIGSADPEIFHTSLTQMFVTEGLVRQCGTDGQLAAILAYEFGRMISEREASVAQEIRQPERLPPIHTLIGSGARGRQDDPNRLAELAKFEEQYPKQPKKLSRPNPQQIARVMLESAGYQRTDFDAAGPLLDNAARFSTLENQFKGTTKAADWKTP